MTKREQIGAILVGLGEYYDKDLTHAQIDMYVNDLEHLEPEQLSRAILTYRRLPDSKFFPLPGQLLALIEPSDELVADDVANRILYASQKYTGTYEHHLQKVKDHVGEIGWLVIQRKGGWASIVNDPRFDAKEEFSRWRWSALNILRQRRLGFEDEDLKRVSHTRRNQELGKLEMNLVALKR